MYQWLIFLHIGAVLSFMLLHGVQVTVMWKQRREADPQRVMDLFEVLTDLLLLRAALAAVVLTGLGLVALSSLWGRWWVWLSLLLLVAIWLAMRLWGAGYLDLVNSAAQRALEARGTADEPEAMAAFEKARMARHTLGMTVVGLGGMAAILWLMIFKPL